MKIAIASGKGGTGKTFLATNLFRSMELAGLCPVLVDCDAEVPNDAIFIKGNPVNSWNTSIFCPIINPEKCTFCNACQEFCTFHAITCVPGMHYIHLSADLCHGCEACMHACTSGAIEKGRKEIGTVTTIGQHGNERLFEARIHEGQRSGVSVIREAITKAEQSNSKYIILDAPPGCSCPFVNTVLGADKVVLITEPTPFGLNDLKQTIEVLQDLNKDFSVVINRSNLGYEALESYLTQRQIPILARIPYSDAIAGIYAQGKLVVDENKEVADIFNQLMQRLIRNENSHY